MESIDKAVVCLDFTAADASLIAYTDFFTHLIQVKEITFLYIVKKVDLPDELKKILHTEEKSYNDFLLEKMENTVQEITKDTDTNYTIKCKVLEGSPMEQVVKYTNDNNVDLVILGRKTKTQGSGIILTRIARRVRCSTLIVPEDAELFLDDILVCADFSEWAKMALDKAIEMSSSTSKPTVYCQHIFEVPTGYHAAGKSFQEFAQIMKKHSAKRYEEFVKGVDTKDVTVAPIITLQKDDGASKIIKDTATSVGANIVIVGSKGKTFTSSIFLGSFAEKLISESMPMPLMIVKSKDETIGIIKALQMI